MNVHAGLSHAMIFDKSPSRRGKDAVGGDLPDGSQVPTARIIIRLRLAVFGQGEKKQEERQYPQNRGMLRTLRAKENYRPQKHQAGKKEKHLSFPRVERSLEIGFNTLKRKIHRDQTICFIRYRYGVGLFLVKLSHRFRLTWRGGIKKGNEKKKIRNKKSQRTKSRKCTFAFLLHSMKVEFAICHLHP
jgi:hypothetical protein